MAAYDELVELVVAVAKTGNLVGALSDGPGLDDLDEAVSALTAIAAGVTGADQALVKLEEGLTAEEFSGLLTRFQNEFDVPQDAAEVIVEKAFKAVVPLAELVAALRA